MKIWLHRLSPSFVLLVGLGATLASSTATPAAAATSMPFRVGVTHTQVDADSWRNPTAAASAKAVLTSSVRLQAQALMGWGTTNPEPSPGVYDWSSLDRRMSLISSSGGTPIVTLCCSPDWMKNGVAGTTNWSRLEVAPTPVHFQDFANLAVAFAQRHPEVRTYLVWNELKGFYSAATHNWDIAGYTQLYNLVYDGLKKLDPTLQVGGPYVSMDVWAQASTMSNPSRLSGPWGTVDQRSLDAVTYWLAHAHGADFVAVDGSTMPKNSAVLRTDDLTATSYFTAVTAWLRGHTQMPIWWSEFYAPQTAGTSPAHGVSVLDAALQAMQNAGATTAMSWQPEGLDQACVSCIYTNTATSTGGAEAPLAAVLRRYNQL